MDMLTLLLSAVASFALFLAAHILLWRRASTSRGVVLLAKLSALCVIAVGIAANISIGVPWKDLVWVLLPLHAFLTLCYFHLYVGTYRSLSMRILGELARAGGAMTFEELDRAYSKEFMFSSRLDILVQHGWFSCINGRYVSTPKGQLFAKLIIALRKLYGVSQAG